MNDSLKASRGQLRVGLIMARNARCLGVYIAIMPRSQLRRCRYVASRIETCYVHRIE